jgi:hypothetical protein
MYNKAFSLEITKEGLVRVSEGVKQILEALNELVCSY